MGVSFEGFEEQVLHLFVKIKQYNKMQTIARQSPRGKSKLCGNRGIWFALLTMTQIKVRVEKHQEGSGSYNKNHHAVKNLSCNVQGLNDSQK